MELLSSKHKQTMERCKKVARDHGLSFRNETLEFVITNEDMIRLSPKGMIPTLYDYWVHDVFVLQDKGKYDLFPGNPYETVINTQPPISFYNDNNPDWLNVMIFYHVIAHIDFFQNNVFFARTWLDGFLARANAHAEQIKELRFDKGRWVDYVIEFSRGLDNLVNFYDDLNVTRPRPATPIQKKFDYFFDDYLQKIVESNTFQYLTELDKYNKLAADHDEETAKSLFLHQVSQKYLDFNVKYEKRAKAAKAEPVDLLDYLMRYSPMLNKEENDWMKSIMQIVRETALYFQPQIRTKILNEGWASYWHEHMFQADEVLRTHEFEYSKINAGVVSIPRVGMNPYAIGLRLFKYLEVKADRGMLTFDYERLSEVEQKRNYNTGAAKGREFIFDVRRFYSDATAINEFIDQDFVNEFRLFVTGKRLNKQRMTWEYYVKSRKANDYRKKMLDSLYHPPRIMVDHERTQKNGVLTLVHTFEGKELVKEYIGNTMTGAEFLWGSKVVLETNEIDEASLREIKQEDWEKYIQDDKQLDFKFHKVRYTMEGKKLSREVIKTGFAAQGEVR